MSQRPFCFLHAADLHLDEPIEGLLDAPGHLVDLLIDCPLAAAKRVFDAAIEHHVDFVVLAGDVVDLPAGSPHELSFLVEQFQRLAQRNIAVYWAGGTVDSVDWPAHYSLPANVKQASRLHLQRHRHEIAGVPVCELVGRSRDRNVAPQVYEFTNSKDDLFSIAVVHAEFSNGLGNLGIRYWALGGAHRRTSTQPSNNSIAHDPGTPQARRPSETGPRGCTLVQVDEQSQVRLIPIATDVIRWESPRLSLGATAGHAELEKMLRDRTSQLVAEGGGAALLIQWTIACNGTLFAELRRGKLASDLLASMQREFGHRTPAAWTVAIEPELPAELPVSWQREETLRGDFLKALQRSMNGDQADASPHLSTLDIDRFVSPADSADEFSRIYRSLSSLDDPEVRGRVLRQAAWLGADLLSPEEAAR
jgi:exonuclease SbcD